MDRVSDPILEIEDLLGRYREDGQVESSGVFTLDPKKAIEKLAEFQLPSPYHWLLKVVQCLVGSGASYIDISAGVVKVSVESDAVPDGFTGIDDLLGHLLVDANHSDPCLRHLAAGLQGSLRTKPRKIEISLTDENERRTYALVSGGWRELEVQSSEEEGKRFKLELHRSVEEGIASSWIALNTDIFDLLLRRPAAYDRENAVVHESCQFTTCDVRIDGKSINNRRFGQPRYKGYDIHLDHQPGKSRASRWSQLFSPEDLIAGAAVPKHHLVEYLVPACDRRGFLLSAEYHATVSNRADLEPTAGLERAYAIRMQLDPKAKLYFIEDGVVIDRVVDQDLGCPGLVALIDARDLGKDLSTLKVVSDGRLTAVFEEVRAIGQTMRQSALDHLERMPAPNYVASRLRASG